MISEYILFGLILPVVILWGIRKENRLEEAQLLDKRIRRCYAVSRPFCDRGALYRLGGEAYRRNKCDI